MDDAEGEIGEAGESGGAGDVGSVAAVVAALRSAVELAEALVDEPVDGAELGSLLVDGRVELQRLEGVLGRLGRRFELSGAWREDGDRNAKCWLARHTRRSKADEERLLRLGKDQVALPKLEEALSAGEIGVGHVEVLAGLARHDRYAEKYRLTEDELLEWARTLYWAEFIRWITGWKMRADEDGAERDAADDEQARYFRISPGLRGTGLADGELTATARETVTNSLELIENELFEADWAEAKEQLGRDPEAHELPRTKAQRLHDALEEMAIRAHTAPADGKRPEPLLSIMVGIDVLEKVCELESGQPITPGRVAPHLDRALVERIVYDGPARIMEIGEKRTFTGALRRAIQARDRTCRFPGCDMPGKWCQVDHVQPWSRGGKTTQANASFGCDHHNGLKGDTPPEQLFWAWESRRIPGTGSNASGDTEGDSADRDDTGTAPPLGDTG